MSIFRRGPCALFCLLAVAAVSLSAASSARAVTVAFTTTGAFGSTGTNVVTSGDSTVRFDGILAGLLDLNVGETSNTSVGEIDIDTVDGTDDTFSDTFVLTITQSLPTAGNDTISATLHGSVRFANSQLFISFTDQIANIAPVIYEVDPEFKLVANTTNQGVTSLQADVTLVPTPGAATAGFALMGLVGLRRRRTA